jgi:type VI secretion system secreted protein Hcp
MARLIVNDNPMVMVPDHLSCAVFSARSAEKPHAIQTERTAVPKAEQAICVCPNIIKMKEDHMPYQFYVTIQGKKQGQFKGESLRERKPGQIPALRFAYQIKLPRDAATGLASGRPQHLPLTITKEWGAASPQLFQALVTNEVLESVLFEFVQIGTEGAEEVYYTIKLTDATIADLKQYLDQTKQDAGFATHAFEDVSFTYQTIEVQHNLAKTAASEHWTQ